ncbi:hypothetical protein HYDPIDRAFT_114906 [Hydnomerulius pinastri MD-312]|uniref:Uncharacterized protein n=1 Tax=Hydnomerulius pinastri MD-312 TaxID=994086 RepID=A0A0C9WDC5_9AGAM|nr:hypothetical protein HYDPIDRAFT_114906 [Hydnomerulius pinastri MD-312]
MVGVWEGDDEQTPTSTSESRIGGPPFVATAHHLPQHHPDNASSSHRHIPERVPFW